MRCFWKRLLPITFMAVVLHGALGLNAQGEAPWPSWRGPNNNGTALPGKYPTKWSDEENIAWKLDLPGRGASTPIAVDDRLYLTYANDEKNTLGCVGLDGTKLWEQFLGTERPGKHAKASGANSSPVTDGQRVFAYFKSGDLGCFGLDGKLQWSLNIQELYGEDSLWWDLGTSPVLTDNAVVIAVMQTGPSFLVALDKNTGKELWKADRRLEAPEEANQSYTTPAIATLKQGNALITVGADHVTAHSVEDGRLLWKVGGLNPGGDAYFRSIASPVLGDGGMAYCPYARGNTLWAVRTDLKLSEDERVAWKKNLGSDVPTPAFYQGKLYLLSDKGVLNCLNPQTGEVVWAHSLPKNRNSYSSSPVVANGHVYCTREDGATFVVSIEGEPKQVAENRLSGHVVATPVFVKDRIVLRSFEALICVQSKGQ